MITMKLQERIKIFFMKLHPSSKVRKRAKRWEEFLLFLDRTYGKWPYQYYYNDRGV